MHDAFDAPLVSRYDGYDQPPFAQGGSHLLVDDAFVLGISENDVQTAGDAREGMVEFPSYLCQLGRCIVFDVPEFVDYLVGAGE